MYISLLTLIQGFLLLSMHAISMKAEHNFRANTKFIVMQRNQVIFKVMVGHGFKKYWVSS